MTDLETLRRRIAALQAQHAALMRAGLSREALHQRLDRFVDGLAERGREALERAVAIAAADQPINPFRLTGNGAATGRAVQVHIDAGPLLVALLGSAAIKKALHAASAGAPVGLAPSARAAQLAELQGELDSAEREEERIICSLEAQGHLVQRRPDARPEIILEA